MQVRTGQESGLQMALEVWKRRKWLAILVFAGILVPVLCFARFLPDLYRATATVLVEQQPAAESYGPAGAGVDVGTRLHIISQEVLSRVRLLDLVERFGLYPELSRKVTPDDIVQRMRRDIDLEPKGVEQSWGQRATIAFALSFEGRDPQKVALVTNALASFYVDENLKLRERQASRTAEFLKAQMEEIKQKLQAEEARVSEFKLRHSGELPQQMEANLATLERLNAQLHLNSENQIRAIERREKLLKPPGGAGALRIEGDEGPAERLARLKRELLDLRTRYSDKYPDVVRLEKEIAALRGLLGVPGEGPASGTAGGEAPEASLDPLQIQVRKADGEIEALRAEERRLRQMVAQYEQRVESAPRRQQEFQELSRDYQTTKDLYDSLLKRYEESLLARSLEHGQKAEEFRILDPALPPKDPHGPNRIWLALMGLLLSFGSAAGAMALAEQLDTSFHSVDALRAFTRVPVLASIPLIVTRAEARGRLLKFSAATLSVALLLTALCWASYYAAHEYEQLVYLLSRVRS